MGGDGTNTDGELGELHLSAISEAMNQMIFPYWGLPFPVLPPAAEVPPAEAPVLTVELGRTSKSIKEILDFTPGTIIELNRIAGEPIDVLVNGKYVAKGEVVIIEEFRSVTHRNIPGKRLELCRLYIDRLPVHHLRHHLRHSHLGHSHIHSLLSWKR